MLLAKNWVDGGLKSVVVAATVTTVSMPNLVTAGNEAIFDCQVT